jgi:RNA polymerase sigma-70 factor, ECF subfamily
MGVPLRRRRRSAPRVAGHPPVFSDLLKPKMRLAIRRWLRGLRIPRSERADVVQDVFTEAWKGWRTYDPRRARPERWLNQIVVHVAIDFHERARICRAFSGDRGYAENRAQRRPTRSSRTAMEIGGNPTPSRALPATWDRGEGAEEALARHEMHMALLGALSRLPVVQAAVIVAHDIDGVSMAAIAARLGASGSTAYRWRALGLAALADLLRPMRG